MADSIRWSHKEGREPPRFGSSTEKGRRHQGLGGRSTSYVTPETFPNLPLESSPRSDGKPHGNDRLCDRPKAGVVVAGVPAHEPVGLVDGDRVLLGGDPLGLFDDDP